MEHLQTDKKLVLSNLFTNLAYMKYLYRIINSNFLRSIIGPFFAFIFPIIFVAILGTLLGYYSVFSGIIAISAIATALTSMPQAIFEFKKSSLLKRIGATPIKPWMFLFAVASFYIFIMIIGTIFSILVSFAIFSGNWTKGKLLMGSQNIYIPSMLATLKNVSWASFIFANLLNIFVASTIGLLLSSISKSTVMLQGMGVPILVISQFLSAQVLPLTMVHDIPAIWYLGYISPFKSTTALMIQSWNGLSTIEPNGKNFQIVLSSFNIFNINDQYQMFASGKSEPTNIFYKPERILNLVLPFSWIIVLSFVSVKTFKWNAR
ncbi:MAG: hypothetical protein ACRDCG_02765 [Mycoplasmoidaceae bacterium]